MCCCCCRCCCAGVLERACCCSSSAGVSALESRPTPRGRGRCAGGGELPCAAAAAPALPLLLGAEKPSTVTAAWLEGAAPAACPPPLLLTLGAWLAVGEELTFLRAAELLRKLLSCAATTPASTAECRLDAPLPLPTPRGGRGHDVRELLRLKLLPLPRQLSGLLATAVCIERLALGRCSSPAQQQALAFRAPA